MEQQSRFELINRNSRGRRYAILIKNDINFNEVKDIIRRISTIWSGNETYLIPYGDNGIEYVFIKMLRVFDPDYIFVWNNDKNIKDFIVKVIEKNTNPFRRQESIFSTIPSYDWQYPHVKTDMIVKRLLDESFLKINVIKQESEDILDNLYISSLIGDVEFKECDNNILFNSFDYEQYFNWIDDLNINRGRLNNIKGGKYFPFDVTMYGLKYLYKNYHENFEEQQCYFIIGNTIREFCYFFNMARYNSFVFFIYETDVKNIESKYNGVFNYINKYDAEIKNIKILYSKDNEDYSEVNSVIKSLIIERLRRTDIEENILEDTIYENALELYNKKGEAERHIFLGRKSLDEIEAQIFEGMEDSNAEIFRWISEIEFNDYSPIVNKNNIYKIDNNSHMQVRLSKKGIAFESINSLINKDMKTKDALRKVRCIKNIIEETLKRLLEVNKCKYEISTQGRYELKIMEKFDGKLDELCDILKNDRYRKIFNEYMKGKKERVEGLCDSETGRVYINYSNIINLVGKVEESNEIINNLVKRRILHRGFLIKCKECSHTFWISLSDIDDYIKCKQCNNEMFYDYEISRFNNKEFEPKIYYKLDEVFYKAWKNNFDVPILTINHLKKKSIKCFEYMPEINIYKDKNDRPYCEMDFICNVDGKLIIGECKSNACIDSAQIGKYEHIAPLIGAEEIYFCTTCNNFDQKSLYSIEEAKKRLKNFGIDVFILNEENLLYED